MKIFLGTLNRPLKYLLNIKHATYVKVGECKIETPNAQEEKTGKEAARNGE
jgi:hypothetical protein